MPTVSVRGYKASSKGNIMFFNTLTSKFMCSQRCCHLKRYCCAFLVPKYTRKCIAAKSIAIAKKHNVTVV